MKKQQISDIISNLGDTIIQEAAFFEKKPISKQALRMKWIAAAACVVLLICLIGMPILKKNWNIGKSEIVLSEALLSVNVYASEPDENKFKILELGEIVTISNEINPLSSSITGLGVCLEVSYPTDVTITMYANNGALINWPGEKDCGYTEDGGYIIEKEGYAIWNPQGSSETKIRVIVSKDEHIVGLAEMEICRVNKDDVGSLTQYYDVTLTKSVSIPSVDGEYQRIRQDYIDEFFAEYKLKNRS